MYYEMDSLLIASIIVLSGYLDLSCLCYGAARSWAAMIKLQQDKCVIDLIYAADVHETGDADEDEELITVFPNAKTIEKVLGDFYALATLQMSQFGISNPTTDNRCGGVDFKAIAHMRGSLTLRMPDEPFGRQQGPALGLCAPKVEAAKKKHRESFEEYFRKRLKFAVDRELHEESATVRQFVAGTEGCRLVEVRALCVGCRDILLPRSVCSPTPRLAECRSAPTPRPSFHGSSPAATCLRRAHIPRPVPKSVPATRRLSRTQKVPSWAKYCRSFNKTNVCASRCVTVSPRTLHVGPVPTQSHFAHVVAGHPASVHFRGFHAERHAPPPVARPHNRVEPLSSWPARALRRRRRHAVHVRVRSRVPRRCERRGH